MKRCPTSNVGRGLQTRDGCLPPCLSHRTAWVPWQQCGCLPGWAPSCLRPAWLPAQTPLSSNRWPGSQAVPAPRREPAPPAHCRTRCPPGPPAGPGLKTVEPERRGSSQPRLRHSFVARGPPSSAVCVDWRTGQAAAPSGPAHLQQLVQPGPAAEDDLKGGKVQGDAGTRRTRSPHGGSRHLSAVQAVPLAVQQRPGARRKAAGCCSRGCRLLRLLRLLRLRTARLLPGGPGACASLQWRRQLCWLPQLQGSAQRGPHGALAVGGDQAQAGGGGQRVRTAAAILGRSGQGCLRLLGSVPQQQGGHAMGSYAALILLGHFIAAHHAHKVHRQPWVAACAGAGTAAAAACAAWAAPCSRQAGKALHYVGGAAPRHPAHVVMVSGTSDEAARTQLWAVHSNASPIRLCSTLQHALDRTPWGPSLLTASRRPAPLAEPAGPPSLPPSLAGSRPARRPVAPEAHGPLAPQCPALLKKQATEVGRLRNTSMRGWASKRGGGWQRRLRRATMCIRPCCCR